MVVTTNCRVILREIKEDTTQILGDTVAIRQDTSDIIDRLDKIQQKLSAGLGADDPASHITLDRYLDELRNDAETVLDSLEYQQNVSGDEPLQPQPVATITLFKDSRKRLFLVPFEACSTWTVSFDE